METGVTYLKIGNSFGQYLLRLTAFLIYPQKIVLHTLYAYLQVIVSDSNGDFVPINIEDIAQVVEVDEEGSTHRTCLKENSSDPLLGF